MEVTTTLPAPSASGRDEWLDRRWRLTGLGLVVAWFAVLTAALFVAQEQRTLGDLERGLRDGSVVDVVLLQPDYDAGARIPVTLSWRDHGIRRYADAVVRPRLAAAASRGNTIYGDPVLHLEDLGARVDQQVGHPPATSFSWTGREWRAPGPFVGAYLAVWFATFLVLVGAPAPWRATRWAWGWLVVLGGPVGALAYVVLGGPFGVARPRPGRRCLTGAWALLLALVLFGGGRAG